MTNGVLHKYALLYTGLLEAYLLQHLGWFSMHELSPQPSRPRIASTPSPDVNFHIQENIRATMATQDVYVGIWINHSRGNVLGVNLTTTIQQGNILIAFTAFLIPFVASRFWKLLCLYLHYAYSTPDPRNAIHHQRQIVLRNSSTPESALVSLVQMVGAWRRSKRGRSHLRSRVLPVALYAIACIVVFTAAGGLSSQISSSTGSQVLLRGDNCGIMQLQTSGDYTTFSQFSQILSGAATYAQQCYTANNTGTLACDKFVAKSLPTAVSDINAPCPFSSDICRENGTSLRLDSGYIHSAHHLGMNVREDEAIEYRYVLQCSPLKTEGYATSATTRNLSLVQYNYGLVNTINETRVSNSSYQVPDLNIQYYTKDLPGIIPESEFKLNVMRSWVENGEANLHYSDFIAAPEIRRQDGDVLLIFLSGNGVLFDEPMDDEWYRATAVARNITVQAGQYQYKTVSYISTEAASPMGCVEQFQWCNTALPKQTRCGPLASYFDSINGAAPLFHLTGSDLDPDSRPSSITADGTRLIWPLLIQWSGAFGPVDVISKLGSKALASQSLLSQGTQLPLPRNQWQLDVMNWFNVTLASLQTSFVNAALGVADQKWSPLNIQEKRLCHTQKIITNAYSSFNVFALLFTYITSGLIILTSIVAERILAFLSRRYQYKLEAFSEWTINGTMQLHRAAQENVEMGDWSRCAHKIPITRVDYMLGGVDIRNPTHPVFSRLSKAL
ncbi:hypothetical protein F5Y19DRAFT_405056 [Xylariaceae sp. FL1651]|nr:hypothetical protein F5Y19DRAFT_405056 [Xylariaceae sp. FL1651]